MRNTFFLLLFLISGACFSQNPDPFWDGIRTKLVQPDTLSTFDRDALTPKLGTILYHKDTGVSRWEQWNGTNWVGFGGDLSYTDISSTNFNGYYVSQEMLKSYLASNSLGEGYYRVKQPKEVSATDYVNIVYNNGEHNAFPSITKTKEGKLILGYRASPVDHNSPNARAEIMISSDNGNSFSDPIVVDDGTDFSGTVYGIRNCYVTQLDSGDLIATYGVNDDTTGGVYYKFSSDGGETWGSRDTLSVSGYSPDKIAMENRWLYIDGDYILPIVSGDNDELDAGFIRTSDFSTFTHTFLTSDTTRYQETRGYIDHSNNTIIFFYQYPVNPDAVLYRQIYDPVNNVVISGQTAVNFPDYRASRTDILFDENRGEMYILARSTFSGPARILVSEDKGLNFEEMYILDNVPYNPVYGEFLQVSQNEALLFFATENEPNGTETKIWGTTFNVSPSQLFHYDGSNVVELSSSYLPKNQNIKNILDSKLDTINYTATDVLTKLLTVDGSGSGLDADLLDGISSGSFLRSDTADSKTSGNLSFENQTRIVFGSPSVAQMYESGSGTLYMILNSADFNIYDGFATPRFTFGRTTGNFTATGTVTATSLIKSGGTSTQYLMADGSTKNEPYLKYVALLTQSGTSAPTATVLENTLGGAVTTGRTGVGTYTLTLGSAFTLNKTVCFTTMGSPITSTNTTNEIRAYRQTSNNIIIQTTQDGVLVDGNLTTATIEVRVYP